MSESSKDPRTRAQLLEEIEQLQLRLGEAEQTLEAIRRGDIDALVVTGPQGEQIFTLAGAEHIYRVIVETMNEAGLTVAPDGTILFCNQRFCDLMKTPIQEALGRKVSAFAARPQQPPLKVLLKDAQAGPVQRRLTLRAADGTIVPVQLAASLLQADENKSICLVATDLTELEASANSVRVLREHQQALEESEARFRAMYEQAAVGIEMLDLNGRLLRANDKLCRMLGYEEEELRQRAFAQITYDGDLPNELLLLDKLLAGEIPSYSIEKRYIHRDGHLVWVRLTSSMAFTSSPYRISIVEDITERKRAEEALRRSEEQYRRLFDEDLAGDFIATPDGKVIECNPAFAEIYGFADREQAGRCDISRFNSGDWADLMARLRAECKVQAHQCVHRRPDGREIHVVANVIGRFNEAAELTEVQGYIYDDTERKRAEEALRKSEEKFARAFRSSPIAVAVTRLSDGRIIEVNEAILKLLHFHRDEVIGHTTLELGIWVDVNDRAQFIQELSTAGSVRDREYRLRTKDGEMVTIHLSAELLEFSGERCMLSTLVDVTERKRAEEALRQSEERYHRLFEDDLTGDFISTPEGQILLCNPAFAGIFGFSSAQDVVGTSILDLYIDAQGREPLLERLKQEGKIERLEVWRKRRDGEPIYVVENLVGHFNERGELYEIKGYVFDDTERKRAEEALRQSEERLKRAQGIAHLGSWELDLANNHLSWSDEMYRIFGLPPQEFKATYEAFLESVHPDDRAAVDTGYSSSLREGRNTYEIEHRIVRRSTGEIRIVHEKCEHIRDASGRIIRSVGMVHDITERKQAEEALRELTRTLETKVAQRTAELEHRARQLQKLALEVSQAEDRERKHLAEILHDDLQQQLAAAKFHLGMLRNRVKYDPAQRSIAGQVDHMLADAIERSRSLSHELSPAILYHGDLGEALEWLAGQVQAKYGLTVHVDAVGAVDAQSDALKVFLYRAAQELLFNVVKHSRINAARIRVRRMGRCLCLCVSDRGRGFDPQELKATAGFGLLSIRERVQLLGGRMRIKAAPGKGSTFFIVVPDGELSGADLERQRVDGEESNGPAGRDASIPEPSRPRLRVLLADDHEIVREGLAALLNDQPDIEIVGQAANGCEAVDLAYQLRPDVVVMDVAMPLMGGDEATRQIKLHMPNTRVIGLSMYGEVSMAEKMRRAGAEAYLLKTGPSDELLATIRGGVAISK